MPSAHILDHTRLKQIQIFNQIAHFFIFPPKCLHELSSHQVIVAIEFKGPQLGKWVTYDLSDALE